MFKKVFLLTVAAVLGFAVTARAQAPYVGAAEADNELAGITSDDMDNIRGKKILFCSRSFGLNIQDGLYALQQENAMYTLSRNTGPINLLYNDISTLPDASIYDTYDLYHVLITPSPYSKRLSEFAYMIRNLYHSRIDAAFLEYHSADAAVFPAYRDTMAALQAEFPHITFVFVTAGLSPVTESSWNIGSCAFNPLSLAAYRGVEPFYDMGDILSTKEDGVTSCGCQMCPEFNINGDNTHPNSAFSERRMGAAFLLLFHKIFNESASACSSAVAPTVPSGVVGTALSTSSVALRWNAATHAECGIKYYQVRRDAVPIGTTYDTTYTDAGLTENTFYTYSVSAVAYNDSASAWSGGTAVSTLPDTTAPLLVGAADTRDSTAVVLEFSEELDQASAETAGNYSVNNGVTVVSASVSGQFVTLTTSAMSDGQTYTVTVAGVKDQSSAGNAVAAGSWAVFRFSRGGTGRITAYWSFDSVRGDTVDDEVGGNNGYLDGPVWTTDGKYGGALEFNGSDTVDAGIGAMGLDTTDELTFACWVKPDAISGDLFRRGTYVQPLWVQLSSGGVRVCVRTGSTNYQTSVADLVTGQWNHVAVTYRDGEQRIYIDGALDSEAATTGALSMNSEPSIIGGEFDGVLDEVYILNAALDSLDVVALMNGEYGGVSLSAYQEDSLAVQALLDANGAAWSVPGIIDTNADGRITTLYLQTDVGGKLNHITSHIGQLTELTRLHAYGPEDHDHTGGNQLISIDPAIGNCGKLTELIINDDDLADLPLEITGLTGITNMSVANNLLCGVSDTLRGWLDTYDSDWEATQSCTDVTADNRKPKTDNGFGFTFMSGKVIISRTAADGPMRADIHALDGQRVYSIQSCCDTQMEWRTSGFGSGLYMITVTDKGKVYTEKVMVVQ